MEELKQQYAAFVEQWKAEHSISPAPSFDSWRKGKERKAGTIYVAIPEDKRMAEFVEFTHIKISVGYELGGMNYFSGSTNRRGVYVYITPVEKTATGEVSTLMGSMKSSGFKICLEELQRKSAKTIAKHVTRIEPLAEQIAGLFLDEEYKAINSLVLTGEYTTTPVVGTYPAEFVLTSGEVREVQPKDGQHFKYEELREFVGGMIEIVPVPSGKVVVVNEEGKLSGLAKNEAATKFWKKEYPIDKYPDNNDELIVGNVLVCDSAMIE